MGRSATPRLSILGLLVLLTLAGCSEKAAVENPLDGSTLANAPNLDDDPTLPTQDAPRTQGEPEGGLRTEFIAWLFPVDRSDAVLGDDVYESVGSVRQDQMLGDCMVAGGFRTLGEEILSGPAAPHAIDTITFPDLTLLSTDGFYEDYPNRAAAVMVESIGPIGTWGENDWPPTLDWVAKRSAENPHWGITEADFRSIIEISGACWAVYFEDGYFYETKAYLSAQQIRQQWNESLDDVDRSDAIADRTDLAMVCLREIGSEFSEAADIEEWFEIYFRLRISLEFSEGMTREVLQEAERSWGQAYGACIGGIVEERVALRAAARDRRISEDYLVLLELQLLVDDTFLAKGSLPAGDG